jgi:hypothetical protein
MRDVGNFISLASIAADAAGAATEQPVARNY